MKNLNQFEPSPFVPGSAPAPGAASRRPRRLVVARSNTPRVPREGADHSRRGRGRSPGPECSGPDTRRRRRQPLLSCLLAGLFVLLASTSIGRTASVYLLQFEGVEGVTTTLYEESTGLLTIALGLERNQPEWKYVNVRRYASHFDGRFLNAADLNNDQRTDLILPLYAANKLLIIWGHTLQQSVIQPELLDVGPGPIAAAPAELTGNAPLELLVATTGSAQVGVRGWDPVQKLEVTGRSDHPRGFAQEGLLGFVTAGSSAGAANPTLAILRRDAGSSGRPTLELFSRNPSPAYGPSNSTHSSTQTITFTGLESGYPLGLTQPGWFMAWGEGLSQVAMVSSAGGAAQIHDLGGPITRAAMHRGNHSGGANFLFSDGSVRFYIFSPSTGFSLSQRLDPPPGESFFAVSVAGDTAVTLSRGGSPYNAFNFRVNINSGAGFAPVAQGIWPAPPANLGQTTVALYTGDPFGNAPLLIESFAAGDWASGTVIAGNQINAVVETSGGSGAGLGSPTPQSLQPGVAPGAGAGTLGNQWERSSSLFYAGSPIANGLAPVGIKPSPGNYPNTIAVNFQPGAGVTVHHRVDLGPWQQGTGPIWLAQDTTIEFFGEHVGGSLSPIQSATYSIDQPPDADGDGDGIPDTIELLAGTDLLSGDSDGDGDSDFKELIAGSDPNDPTSRAGPHVKVFDGMTASFVWDDAASAVVPADVQDLFFSDPASPGLAAKKGNKVPGLHKVSDVTLKRGVISQQAWFPAGYAVEGVGGFGPAMTALVGIQFPPVPGIPVNLNAADPVATWLAAAQAALDAFHATPPEFTVGPASTMGAVIIEYWYGTRLFELGRISSLAQRPRLADTPNSPFAGHLTAADIDAIQAPASLPQPGHQLAHVWQQLNTAIQIEPAFAPLRQSAEAAFAQAMLAADTDSPLDPPIEALRRFIGGDPVPVGYLFPIVQATAINLRDQMLALVDPRPQVEITGELAYNGYHVELETIAGRYTLFKPDGTPVRASSAGWLVPGATADVRGFLLSDPPPAGIAGEIEVLAIQIIAVPEAGYADLDGNSLPDAWQQIFLGGLGGPLGGDTDGDGYLDPEELGAGTDPTDPLATPTTPPATPRDMRIEFTPGVGPSLVWDGSTTVDYEVWVTPGFFAGAGWNPLPTTVQSSGPERRVAPIDDTQPQSFYRVRIKFLWLNEP